MLSTFTVPTNRDRHATERPGYQGAEMNLEQAGDFIWDILRNWPRD